MRPDHPVLAGPLQVRHTKGALIALKRIGQGPANQGEAIELDSILNSCDAEVVAWGTSDKGPLRGAIVRHGPYTLWGYAGGVGEMSKDGKALFVNTVHFAAAQQGQVVLERRRNKTRDGLGPYLESPGLVETMRQYLPESLGQASAKEIEAWLQENRPYFTIEGRRLQVDEFARGQGIPNHRVAFLQRAVQSMEENHLAAQALVSLERLTGQTFGDAPEAWRAWFDKNRPYLFFSDCDGFRWLVDEEAKAAGVPTAELRGWSSEELDYVVRKP